MLYPTKIFMEFNVKCMWHIRVVAQGGRGLEFTNLSGQATFQLKVFFLVMTHMHAYLWYNRLNRGILKCAKYFKQIALQDVSLPYSIALDLY